MTTTLPPYHMLATQFMGVVRNPVNASMPVSRVFLRRLSSADRLEDPTITALKGLVEQYRANPAGYDTLVAILNTVEAA